MSKSAEKSPQDKEAVFVSGSTLKHVVVMTGTGAVGLVSIFFVDVVNLFYISLLGEQELAAAVGYASTVMFFTVSISIGFTIAATAVTAKALGAADEALARRNAGASLLISVVMSVIAIAIIIPSLPAILALLGATGRTGEIALTFMYISMPSMPLMFGGMALSGLLRAKGDAKRAMYVTLSAGFAALVFDPLLIFGLDLGVNGAAISIILIRLVLVSVGIYGAIFVHDLVALPTLDDLKRIARPFSVIAFPAVLTQIATPIGNAWVTASIAEYGDDAVAGWAIVGRLMPLAFAAVFSLSGAVGPILSQNLGARKFDRVTRTMWDSLLVSLVYCVVIWALLAVLSPWISEAFQARGDADALVRFFCLFVAGSFVFNGALFVANAAFNNLGFPVYATLFNWGRATLGVIPFVWVGKQWGPEGILAGWGLGGIVFGAAAVWVCFRALKRLPEMEDLDREGQPVIPTGNSPFTTGKGASAG